MFVFSHHAECVNLDSDFILPSMVTRLCLFVDAAVFLFSLNSIHNFLSITTNHFLHIFIFCFKLIFVCSAYTVVCTHTRSIDYLSHCFDHSTHFHLSFIVILSNSVLLLFDFCYFSLIVCFILHLS